MTPCVFLQQPRPPLLRGRKKNKKIHTQKNNRKGSKLEILREGPKCWSREVGSETRLQPWSVNTVTPEHRLPLPNPLCLIRLIQRFPTSGRRAETHLRCTRPRGWIKHEAFGCWARLRAGGRWVRLDVVSGKEVLWDGKTSVEATGSTGQLHGDASQLQYARQLLESSETC